MRVCERLDFGPVQGLRVGYAPVGQPLMSVIFYWVDGLLIDTGAGNARESFDELTKGLPIERALLTHYHEDHSGNAARLSKARRVPIYGSAKTVDIMRKGFRLRPYEHYMWGRARPAELREFPGTIETAKYKFTALYTPGHAEDHLVYYEANQGWLFSGDMYLGPRIRFFRSDEDLQLTIDSLHRMLELDFGALFCGHNPQTRNAKAKLRKKARYLEQFRDEVFGYLDDGVSPRQIAKRLRQREDWFTRIITLGDVSLKRMIEAACRAYRRPAPTSAPSHSGESESRVSCTSPS